RVQDLGRRPGARYCEDGVVVPAELRLRCGIGVGLAVAGLLAQGGHRLCDVVRRSAPDDRDAITAFGEVVGRSLRPLCGSAPSERLTRELMLDLEHLRPTLTPIRASDKQDLARSLIWGALNARHEKAGRLQRMDVVLIGGRIRDQLVDICERADPSQ